MSITAVAAASRANAALFAEASAQHGKLGTVAIEDCGTVVPHKIPIPPPPPPFSELAHFAGVSLNAPTRLDDGWCGTVPHKFPPPPPPPAPFAELARFAGALLNVPTRLDDDWCGTVPHKIPLPPPPPPPWVDGINQMLGAR